ncbi:MAG TPA: TIGR04013 family B12-binding domain/radical SAM domain-containing protein [Candidatus Wallbacteria bacterium]|nr:TIGR04013 family B12-binding domain/radical SAM domain-containing protein [Candidatus Wallbacteria bacterium]
MKKINLIIFETDVNRFSVAYLLFILEKEKFAGNFDLHFFKTRDDIRNLSESPAVSDAPCVFMFSFMSSLLCEVIENIAEIKKRFNPSAFSKNCILIAGGPHVTGDPDSGVKMGFDLNFKGEAENSWPDFLRLAVEKCGESRFREKILSCFASAVVKDERPVPLDRYLPFGDIYSLVPPLEIMRGCFYNCRFCQTATCEVKYRSLSSIEEFFAEYRRRLFKRLCFICPSAFHYSADKPSKINADTIEWMLQTAREKYGIKYIEYGIFPSEARPETINDETAGIIKKYCSNKRVSIGAQSGDSGRIARLRRGHGLDAVHNACETLKRHGLTAVIDFIFGFPEETEEEQLTTLAAIKDIHTRYGSRIQTHFFLPLPGTPLYSSRFSPLGQKALKLLEKYSAGGICTDWYAEGIEQSKRICEVLDSFQNNL